jgi:UDP-N-acetylmuramoyl-L-alanyl-D-glutamate--2,6-diaminopimelate ligase
MKLLKDILYNVRINDLHGNTHIAVESICMDSRLVKKLSLFVAVKGTQVDGHLFIERSIESGAVAVVCEQLPMERNPEITYVVVQNSAAALGQLAANFYDNPSEKMKVVGVTGTNGKTTVATLLYTAVMKMGYKAGLLSTVRNRIINDTIEATHTTPDAITIQRLMAEMVNRGCTYCFMEVSSIALDQYRVFGIRFAGAIFTNITHDHLDYHITFDRYITAKKLFFDWLPADAFALLNADDRHAKVMIQNCKAKRYTFSLQTGADFKARIIEKDLRGMHLHIDHKEVWTKLTGVFNASNVLAVYAACRLLGLDQMSVLTSVSTIDPVEGRFNTIQSASGVTGIVDYAHTPDALENIISAVREVMKPGARLITVVGCGGDRDKTKRPVMGSIACKQSDKVIFTSDNPRSENPEAIIADMKSDLTATDKSKLVSITDRAEAISAAVQMASVGDVILIAGKGHEKYQEIKGVKHDFDDRAILNELFNNTVS